MAAVLSTQQADSPLHRISPWMAHAAVVIFVLVGFFITYNGALAEETAKATEAGEAVEFEIEDVYGSWALIILAAAFMESAFFGFRQRWAFASVIQISLIVLLAISFLLISQRVERDVFNVGVLSLIFFTLFQIAFGNISPQANLRQSLQGVVIAAVIIGAVVGFSVWLVPYLIQLGR